MPHRFTGRRDGDLAPASVGSADRWRRVVDLPWRTVNQVHGSDVAVVTGERGGRREDADALVTADPGVALAVFTADCAPIVLESDIAVGVVHAGWRGLVAGVVPRAVEAMRQLGATEIRATLGPCIHPGCYEFSPADLEVVVAAVGDEARGVTSAGRPALDLPAAVRASLQAAGVAAVDDTGVCTACSGEHFSHRAHRDPERQAAVAWRQP